MPKAENTVTIKYCSECGFLSSAASLAADIEKALGIQTHLLEGHGGIFEVSLNGKLMFSNKAGGSKNLVKEKIIKDIMGAILSIKKSKTSPNNKSDGS